MKRPPIIIVQLVHIAGPMKGLIQEFSEGTISIGRHSSCHLCFPADLTVISRKHAEIVREGNQFKLIDHSSNGTFVNGKQVKETYLKTGDVLDFAEGGPKVSFLMEIREEQPEIESTEPLKPLQEKEPEPEPFQQRIVQPLPVQSLPKEETPAISIQTVKAPLTIQYGPTIRSFKELPVTIGQNPKCGFVIMHAAILDMHAQIFFSNNQYWIKDLTGQNLIYINRQPTGTQAPLNLDDEISLSLRGPVFRFLGEGRLAESIERPGVESAIEKNKERSLQHEPEETKEPKGILSRFKKFWSSE